MGAGSSSKFLIMGSTLGQEVQTTFIMPFGKSRSMKRALRMFQSLNCSDPTLFTGKGDAHLSKEPGGGVIKPEQVIEDGKKKRVRGKKKDQDVMSDNQKERKTDSKRRRGRKKSKENRENHNQDHEGKVNIPTEHYHIENSGIDMKTVEKMVEMGGVKLNKRNDNRKHKGSKRENGRKRERQ